MKKAIPITTSKGNVVVPDRMRFLNETERHAVLATALQGKPYTSIVAFALTKDMKGVLFATPKNTRKYRNIIKNNHVALLVDNRNNTDKAYMGAESVSILGTAKPVRRGKRWLELSRVFIRKHTALREFVKSPSTGLILVEAKRCIHVSQFQMISEWMVR
jgi:nitroimidazol reductase NimA-like FMN-containing flavoprotein (pyridoxamine 5'-phosphate oxidase superfamily)